MIKQFKSKSQAGQDVFVASTFGPLGTYIEIGAAGPAHKSNTYNLELHQEYKGFGLELNREAFEAHWKTSPRKNRVYWDDALNFNYKQALEENNLPMHITYLSCDIEPAHNTFAALKKVIETGITFDCITFEHDNGNPDRDLNDNNDYDLLSKDFLEKHGYKLAVYDVKNLRYSFESWYVKKDVDFTLTSWDQWKENILKWNNLRGKS